MRLLASPLLGVALLAVGAAGSCCGVGGGLVHRILDAGWFGPDLPDELRAIPAWPTAELLAHGRTPEGDAANWRVTDATPVEVGRYYRGNLEADGWTLLDARVVDGDDVVTLRASREGRELRFSATRDAEGVLVSVVLSP